jgi:hypothetical protein
MKKIVETTTESRKIQFSCIRTFSKRKDYQVEILCIFFLMLNNDLDNESWFFLWFRCRRRHYYHQNNHRQEAGARPCFVWASLARKLAFNYSEARLSSLTVWTANNMHPTIITIIIVCSPHIFFLPPVISSSVVASVNYP